MGVTIAKNYQSGSGHHLWGTPKECVFFESVSLGAVGCEKIIEVVHQEEDPQFRVH